MDCKKTIYYNLDTKEYYEVAKHVGFKTLDELFEKFGTDIEFKVESCNVTKKICEEIETFKSLCKKNKIKLVGFVFEDILHKRVNLKSVKSQFELVQKLGLDIEIRVNDQYFVSPKEYINALMQIKNLAKRINSFKFNGVELTIFEKWILAFHFVANRVYKEDPRGFYYHDMRHWVGVINGDNVICSGYASLLTKVCAEVFEPHEVIVFHQGSIVYDKNDKILGGHANNLVLINDDKYNICGCYHSDSCWCSARKVYENPFDNDVVFNYCLIPLTKLLKSAKHKFHFDEDAFIYKHIGAKHDNRFLSEYKAKQDNIENYILSYFGYRNLDKILTEMPEDRFNKIKKDLTIQRAKIIIDKLLNKNITKQEFLNKKVPTLMVLGIFAENNKDIKSFVENIYNLVNNKKCNKQFICDMLLSHQFEDLCDKVKEISGDILSVYTVSEMIENAIQLYFNDKEGILNNVYQNYIEMQLDNEINRFVKYNKKIIDPKVLDIELYRKPLTILASFIGITNNEEVEAFVSRKLEETSNWANKIFTGVFEPIDMEAQEVFDNEFKF